MRLDQRTLCSVRVYSLPPSSLPLRFLFFSFRRFRTIERAASSSAISLNIVAFTLKSCIQAGACRPIKASIPIRAPTARLQIMHVTSPSPKAVSLIPSSVPIFSDSCTSRKLHLYSHISLRTDHDLPSSAITTNTASGNSPPHSQVLGSHFHQHVP